MERTLEPRDIVRYFPYGLKIKMPNFIGEINTFSPINNDFTLAYMYSTTDWRPFKFMGTRHKPILRPISDLYRTITHNGKEIIPIVELAKIAEPKQAWEFKEEVAVCEHLISFIYDERKEVQAFCLLNYDLEIPCFVCNQYQLFDYMNELKIDYRNLIGAGLAIDCNTLENNPYK